MVPESSLYSKHLLGHERPVQFSKGQVADVSVQIEAFHLQPLEDSQSRLGRKLPWNWIQKAVGIQGYFVKQGWSQGPRVKQTLAFWYVLVYVGVFFFELYV